MAHLRHAMKINVLSYLGPLIALAILPTAHAGVLIKGTVLYQTRTQASEVAFTLRMLDKSYGLEFTPPNTKLGEKITTRTVIREDGQQIAFYSIGFDGSDLYLVRSRDAKIVGGAQGPITQDGTNYIGTEHGMVFAGNMPPPDAGFPQAQVLIFAVVTGHELDSELSNELQLPTGAIINVFNEFESKSIQAYARRLAWNTSANQPSSLILTSPGYYFVQEKPKNAPINVRPLEYDSTQSAYKCYEVAPYDTGYKAFEAKWNGYEKVNDWMVARNIEIIRNVISYDTRKMKEGIAQGTLTEIKRFQIHVDTVDKWNGSTDDLLPRLGRDSFITDYRISDGKKPITLKVPSGKWLRNGTASLEKLKHKQAITSAVVSTQATKSRLIYAVATLLVLTAVQL